VQRAFPALVAAAATAYAAFALSGPSLVMAAPAKGGLSATEFTHLSAEIKGLKAAETSKHINWNTANAACREAGTTTGLLRIQRQFCLIVNATSEVQFKLQAGAVKCAAAEKTTPATTTTTPATTATKFAQQSAAEIKQLGCLNADYQALGRDAGAYYHEDMVARRKALARGFRGLCFKTLSDTAEEVRHVESFAFTARHLADDAALIVKVNRGQAPSTDVNPVWIDDDGRDFAEAVQQLQSEKPVEKLKSCPHT
jgi:hypothetical protein